MKLETISHYRILDKLGAGGMGEVYLAEDTRLHRKVALKFLPAELTADADRVRRFEQEAQAASALNHPNIITVFDIGECEAGRFIVMELVVGRTLRTVIEADSSLENLLTLSSQMAKALSAAHAAGITHRDIKPDNIMVREDGYVKVLDFGLARLRPTTSDEDAATLAQQTMPGMLLGTVAYMSPEQARGERVNPPSDIFALGIVLYELLTGQHPFRAETLVGYLHAITLQTPPPLTQWKLQLPAALNALILRMLSKDASQRPTASEVAQALQDLERRSTALNLSPNLSSGEDQMPLTMLLAPTTSGKQAGQTWAAPSTQRHTVGRERERNELRAAFNVANDGRGSLLCVAGEPGIGKTTLVEEFLTELTTKHQCTIARGRCSERLAGTEAYLPLLEALESLLQNNQRLAPTLKQVAPTWYAQVLPLTGDGEEAARLLGEVKAASQERMKRELAALLQTVATPQPLVLFFDDLHWADVSTIDLLSFLAGKFAALRVLIVVTYRPSDMLLAKHPFLQIKPDLQARGLCRELLLEFLAEAEIADYLRLEFPRHAFPPDFARLIHAKTEGSPLFMADLVRYLRDRGVITQTSGTWKLAQTLPHIERELPESVRGMIERKIAQLSEDDRKLLTCASVQGYEFDSAVVAQVLKLDADEIEERLEKLERVFAFVKLASEAEFPNRALTLKYRFVHVLYQNALYASLRVTRKAAWSAAVAQALEGFYGAQSASVANELAVLCETAREGVKAADYFLLGAQQASQIFATHEARQLVQRGLTLVQQMPETAERQRRELSLQVILGSALLSTLGLAAPEVAQAYARIRELSQQTGDTQHLLPLLFGQALFLLFKADLSKGLEIAEEFKAIAEQQHDPAVIIAGRLIAQAYLFKGELQAARQHWEKVIAAYNPTLHQPLTWRYIGDLGVIGYGMQSLTLWALGYPEQALVASQESLRLAAAIPHAHTQALSFTYAALLHQNLRTPQRTFELSAQQIRLSEEHGLGMVQAFGTTIHAWAKAELGEIAPGIEEMRESMEGLRATGTELLRSYYFCIIAELCGKARQVKAGFAALAEAQAAFAQNEERWAEAELYRLRGELLLLEGAAVAEVESCFQQAIKIAQRQEAKSLELRAVMSLARSWQQQGKLVEAQQILAEIYGWFTEGFDTADLKDAKALLEELQQQVAAAADNRCQEFSLQAGGSVNATDTLKRELSTPDNTPPKKTEPYIQLQSDLED